jgi:hypothetical protein
MPGVRLLDRVDSKRADGVDDALVDVGVRQRLASCDGADEGSGAWMSARRSF